MSPQHATACPRCGRPLPPNAIAGACPRCLLAAGLTPGDGGAGAGDLEAVAELFPGLELLEVRGQGGMGMVYKARQTKLDRLVALKVLLPEVAGEPGFADRFLREARALARLQHPHIVGVYEFGEVDGLYYLIMEYVDGPTLRAVLQSGGLEPAQALTIVPQICDALQFAHDQGIVHRDIKPENILLDRTGRVKIADFGLAKLAGHTGRDQTLTRAGQVMGTLHYMAPEQYQHPELVDHRADIYSLGVVFYEMLTGQLPIGRFDPPSQKVQVDVRLDDVVLRALEHEVDRRFQHASDVRAQMDSIASAPRAAAPRVAAAASPAGPRTSRMAVWSFCLLPVGLFLGLLTMLLMPAMTGDSGDNEGLMNFAGFLVLAPFILSPILAITSLIRIPLSNGRLRGLGWAIAGLVCSLVLALPVTAWLVVGGSRVEGPEGLTPPGIEYSQPDTPGSSDR